MNSIIDDITLAKAGEERIRWFREQMPLMAELRRQFAEERAFEGKKIGICLHVEPKTAV
ncbi:MAG: adenosylhomocysteinase [Lachnospiraceae bacterium]|nr:adenosylhomocysteinase [Lachnospiraceae bacterium]